MAETPEAPKSPSRNLLTLWVAINLGIPSMLLVMGPDVLTLHRDLCAQTAVVGYVIILAGNAPLSWLLSRRRQGLCVLIYAGSVLLGCGLNLAGCIESVMYSPGWNNPSSLSP